MGLLIKYFGGWIRTNIADAEVIAHWKKLAEDKSFDLVVFRIPNSRESEMIIPEIEKLLQDKFGK